MNEYILTSENLMKNKNVWKKSNSDHESEAKSKFSKNSFIHDIRPRLNKISHKSNRVNFLTKKYPLTDFYYDQEKDTCFTNKVKPKQFQFFGSNIDRFQEEEQKKPGPGDYQILKYFDNHHKVAFSLNRQKRFGNLSFDENENRLGPGCYNPRVIEKNKEITNFCEKPAVFGSGTKRFINNNKVFS